MLVEECFFLFERSTLRILTETKQVDFNLAGEKERRGRMVRKKYERKTGGQKEQPTSRVYHLVALENKLN